LSANFIPIIGYGTFITHDFWKDKKNVEVCRVKNYKRIYIPEKSWFPYALPQKNSYFKALKFEVTKQELEELDTYEGVKSGLFKRIKTEIINVIHHGAELPSHMNFSSFLAEKLGSDYSNLSSLFSSIEGMTIEKYIILQKVEKSSIY